MRRSLILTAGCAAVLLLAASCSTSPPKIAQTFWQLNLVRNPATDRSHESLSLFLHVTDDNGLNDLDLIYLINDATELYWRLQPSNWQVLDENGEQWVGSNSIEMPDLSALPRGGYRVLLSNLAGERVTDDIFVSAERLNAAGDGFPEISISGGKVTVRKSPFEPVLWLFNPSGRLVGTRRGSGTYPATSLVPSGGQGSIPLTLYAYAYDKNCGCGLISGPYDTGS
ncbi:MAG TPA: hypothetical protein VMW69_07510 [Spirochaetia bacterium]|nr:hypothetical protein [Spirochaetia bacterium]